MDDFDGDRGKFRAHFLAANANEEFISEQVKEAILDLLRAISSPQGSERVSEALGHFVFSLDLFTHRETDLSVDRILFRAVDEIKEALERKGTYADNAVDAARAGIKYVAELASSDNAAKGRASMRERSFREACEYWLKSRGER